MLAAAPIVPAEASRQPQPGTFSLVLASSPHLMELETRLLLENAARGQDAVLVCGDNRLDAYGILARARACGIEDAVADGVRLARAFTVHQFLALVEETLPRMVRELDPGAVGIALVTGILAPFGDEDVTEAEARILLPRTLQRLAAFAAQAQVAVVATADERSPFAPFARELAPTSAPLPFPVASRQLRLPSFAEAA